MKILTRYILGELVQWFAMALSVMTLIIVIFVVTSQAIQKGLPPGPVLHLIPYSLPFALSLAVPGTLLLATTSVYGRLAGWNEVVAIKTQGISPRKILEPMWVLAFLISLAMVFVNDQAASWGRNGAERIINESFEEIAYGMLHTQHQWNFGDFSVYVKDVDDRKLIAPKVLVTGRGDSPTVRITADEAEFRSDSQRGEILLFRNGRADYDGRYTILFSNDTFEIPIPIHEVRPSDKPSQIALGAISDEIIRQRAVIEKQQRGFAAYAACEMLCGDFEALTGSEWRAYADALKAANERLCRLRAEPHRRWSAGFSCLCFAWVGAPMAIRLRNRDMLTSFFLCFMPILIVYYPLLLLGVDGAKDGRLPPWSVWAGNLLMLVWGTYLLRKVLRY